MRLVTVRLGGSTRAGRVDGDDVVLLDAPDVKAVLGGPDGLARAADADGETVAVADCELAPVIPWPDKIACVGLNYRSHIAETGRDAPTHPTYFAKYARCLIGPNDPVHLPPASVSERVDWECELGVVIGRPVRHATPAGALDAIAGYTVVNDVSVRDWQRRSTQFLVGKTFEATTPLGPVLVTTDELGDGSGLPIRTTVDDVVKQDGNTADLVFGAVDLVVDLSRVITLEPGDVISTGTPEGVGAARTPPEFLQPGQTMTTSIEGIGDLVNPCVRDPEPG